MVVHYGGYEAMKPLKADERVFTLSSIRQRQGSLTLRPYRKTRFVWYYERETASAVGLGGNVKQSRIGPETPFDSVAGACAWVSDPANWEEILAEIRYAPAGSSVCLSEDPRLPVADGLLHTDGASEFSIRHVVYKRRE